MKLRLLVGLILLGVATIIVALAFCLDDSKTISDLFLNLGSELLGIFITVLFIDYIFTRKNIDEEAKRIAWEIFHELDYAIWIWQGGEKKFDFDKLNFILGKVQITDKLAVCTKNIFTRIGSRAENTSITKKEILAPYRNSKLKYAINELRDLNQAVNYNFENDHNEAIVLNRIHLPIKRAFGYLSEFLQLPKNENYDSSVVNIDSSIDQQEKRFYGR